MNNAKKGFIFHTAFIVLIAAVFFAIGGVSVWGGLHSFNGDRNTANELAKQLDSSGERIRGLESRLARSEQDSNNLRKRLEIIHERSGAIERGIIASIETSRDTVDTVERLRTILGALEKSFTDFGVISSLSSGGDNGLPGCEFEGGEGK
jgi:septal ring factor EnvC (AmiA/AmiB activator)